MPIPFDIFVCQDRWPAAEYFSGFRPVTGKNRFLSSRKWEKQLEKREMALKPHCEPFPLSRQFSSSLGEASEEQEARDQQQATVSSPIRERYMSHERLGE